MNKAVISYTLVLCTLMGLLCGCTLGNASPGTTTVPEAVTAPPITDPPTEPPTEPPKNTESLDFLRMLYKDEVLLTPVDYYLVSLFPVGDVNYKAVWTTDAPEDVVTLTDNGDGTVLVDVNELCQEDTPYTLTASIATAEGYRLTHTWNRIIPRTADMVAIVEEAYTLQKGERMDHQVTLTGTITSIDKEWSEDYGSITVTIVVPGCESMPIRCYSLQGEGIAELKRGDVITVTGILQNYSSRIEFDIGCTLVNGDETPGKEESNEE